MINRMGFNNRGQPAALRAARGAHAARHRRGQYRRQQGQRRPHRRLCRRRRGRWRRSPTTSRSTSARPTRPACAICRTRRARRAARGGARGARRGRPADLPQGRARPRRRRARRRSSGSRSTTAVDALIVANTTVSRPPLKSRHRGRGGRAVGRAAEAAGARARCAISAARAAATLPLIGVGGIANGRRRVGADPRRREPGPALHARWSIEGPGIARRIADGLAERARGATASRNIAEAVGKRLAPRHAHRS